MKATKEAEATSTERRRILEEDVNRFLDAGNRIQYIDSGVSAQDPQGKGRPLHWRRPAGKEPKQSGEQPGDLQNSESKGQP